MPPVVAAVAAYFAVSTTMAVFIIATAVVTLASVAYSAYMMATMDVPSGASDVKGRLQTIRSSVQPHRIIYGEVMTGGVLVDAASHGDKNQYITLVVAFAGHEVAEIKEVWLNDRLSTDVAFVKHIEAQAEEGYWVYATNESESNQWVVTRPAVAAHDESYVTITKYLGTDTQTADAYLMGITPKPSSFITSKPSSGLDDMTISGTFTGTGAAVYTIKIASVGGTDTFEWKKDSGSYSAPVAMTGSAQLLSDGISVTFAATTGHSMGQTWEVRAYDGAPWTSAHRLRGIAYVVVTLEQNNTAFPTGLPNVKCLIRGNNQIYDPRTQTYGYSQNWALCVRDYLTKVYGLNAPAEDIDDTSFIAAANLCDETVTTLSGESQPRYTCNGTFTLDKTPTNIMQDLLLTAGGALVWTQGQYRCYPAAYIPPDLSFHGMNANIPGLTESDLRGEITVRPTTSLREKFNAVVGTYVSPETWQPIDFPKVKNDTYAAEDGGEIVKDLQLSYVTNPSQAQRVAKIMLERGRQAILVDFPAKWSAFPLAVGDTVPVTIAQLGWDQKLFKVLNWELASEGGVNLSLQEEAEAVYDWNNGMETAVDLAQNTILPNPRFVWPVSNLQLTPRVYDSNAGTATRVDLYIVWTAGGPGQLRYEVQYQDPQTAMWLPAGETPDTVFTVTGLSSGNYNVRVRGRNIFGALSDWVSAGTFIPEPDSVVPNVTGLEITNQGNNTEFTGADCPIRWNKVSPRLNSSTSDAASATKPDAWFRYYELKIYHGQGNAAVLRRTEYLRTENYTYTHLANHADGGGTASRYLRFEVRAVATWEAKSPAPALLDVSNPAPAALTGIVITGAVNTFTVALPMPAEVDFAGFVVHASQTHNFTPNASTQINTGGADTSITVVDVPAGMVYIRAAAYDKFGPDQLNYSDEYQVNVISLQVVPEMLDAAQRVDFWVRDSIFYFTTATLNWGDGHIDRGTGSYTLTAGTLANANASYVIATLTDGANTAAISLAPIASGLPTLTANQVLIAVTSDTQTPQGNYICFMRQANSVVYEGALIRDATITDAKISGTLAANRITSLNGATQISGQGITLLHLGETANWGQIPDRPTSLAGLDSTASTKLAGIEAGATAGAIWGTNLSSIPSRFLSAPNGAGLFVTASYMGYYNGGSWKTYMDSSGNFYLSGSGTHTLSWNGATLTIRGDLTADDIQAGGTITGSTLQTAASGNRFVVSAADGFVYYYNSSNQVVARIGTGSGGYTEYGTFGNKSINGGGVKGASNNTTGVLGESTQGFGVAGFSDSIEGVYGAGATYGGAFAAGSKGNIRLAPTTSWPTNPDPGAVIYNDISGNAYRGWICTYNAVAGYWQASNGVQAN